MEFNFQGKQIVGVLSVLPEHEYTFEEEALNPTDTKNRRLKKIIGFGKRRRVKGDTVLSDMLIEGLKYLISSGKLNKDEIGAVVVSTLSQDYILPSISTIIHGELDLNKDVFCIDTPQACAGYVMGMLQGFMLLDHMTNKKVILCTGEIFNRKSEENEPKFDNPSFGGDIANITILQNSDSKEEIHANVFNDGKEREALLIRDGGFKNPMTPEKIKMQHTNIPFMGVEMDGSAVFNFVQKEVPIAIGTLLKKARVEINEIDYFLFHQPNKFMLQKLSEQLGVECSKVPMNITETLGNSDSGTIPAVMTNTVAEELLSRDLMCCFSGFGGGLTWASLVMKVEKLEFCENIVSKF